MKRFSLSNLIVALLLALTFAPPASARDEKGPAAADKAMAADMIDINSASKKELMALPGIGDARADAIIKGRPYRGKNELAEKSVIPQDVYDKVKDQIIAKQKK